MQPIGGVNDDTCNPLRITPATGCATPLQPTAPESDESNQMKESDVSPDSTKSDHEKSAKKRQVKTSDPNVKIVIEYFCTQYEHAFKAKYTVSGQRDGKIVKDLLKDHLVETLKRCIDLFLADADPWLNGKRTIPVLRSRINQYVQTIAKLSPSTARDYDEGEKHMAELREREKLINFSYTRCVPFAPLHLGAVYFALLRHKLL